MIVFVVTSTPKFADTEVEGVFSSLDLAEMFVAGFHETHNMEIHERTLDGSVPHKSVEQEKK